MQASLELNSAQNNIFATTCSSVLLAGNVDYPEEKSLTCNVKLTANQTLEKKEKSVKKCYKPEDLKPSENVGKLFT